MYSYSLSTLKNTKMLDSGVMDGPNITALIDQTFS